ncbi:MAG: hypothetical protein ACI9QN_001457, partial [Arcticibacterium sp.]
YNFSPSVVSISVTGEVTANANTYTFTETSAAGCTSEASVDVVVNTQPATPSVNITGTDDLTCTATKVTRTATGGGTYSWNTSPVQTSETANITSPGTYTVMLTGANGCTATSSTVVTQDIVAPSPSISGTGNLTCTTSSVSRTASGGASYSWSNRLGTNTIANITSAGIYIVTITAYNGCTITATTEVVFEDDLVVTASNGGPYIEGDNVNLVGTGGLSYLWQGPNGFTSTLTAPSIASGMSVNAGIYTVTVQNGACSGTATTEVNISCSSQGMTYYLAFSGTSPEIIARLVPGLEVQFSARPMTVMAVTNCELPVIESVKFQLSGTSNLQYYVDNNMPFRAHEINRGPSGDNLVWNLYTFIARGYDQEYADGNVLVGPDIIQFNIVGGDGAISSPILSTNSLCVGTSLVVSANQTGSFNSGNVFRVYLSDANGGFSNPILIGTSANPNTIACTIPNYLPSSTSYKVMVRSSSPVVLSLGSTTNLSIISANVNLTSPMNDILNSTKNQQAGFAINATNKIQGSSNVTYKAGNYISLESCFSSAGGTIFKAETEKACAD